MVRRIILKKTLFFLLMAFHISALWAQNRYTREQYINKYKDWAVEDMKKSGVPASIKLAQGILESNSGNSQLAIEANNHFGIKCHTNWDGERVFHHDDARNECFRKYKNALESFEDHSLFLTSRDRYATLFDLETTDYKGWAHGLSKAGYATNPNYAQILIRIIEENELYLLDQDISSTSKHYARRKDKSSLVIDPYSKRITEYNNGVRYVRLQPGDTFEELSHMFKLKSWELPNYNDLKPNADISQYSILYIENKRRNAHPDFKTHIVAEGESLHDISQQYGVRLNRLYYFNNLRGGEEPRPGDRINLRSRQR